jgi:heat shock protein HslJ
MRLLALAAAFAMTPLAASAESLTGTDWQLLAIDGLFVEIPATLRLDEPGSISGKAPCNRFSGRNQSKFPELKLQAIASTKMACDRLAEEQVFFQALGLMDRLDLDGSNLVLTAPDGRSMEFVREPANSLIVCKTCPPTE